MAKRVSSTPPSHLRKQSSSLVTSHGQPAPFTRQHTSFSVASAPAPAMESVRTPTIIYSTAQGNLGASAPGGDYASRLDSRSGNGSGLIKKHQPRSLDDDTFEVAGLSVPLKNGKFKPMSLSFMYRMISSLTEAKMKADFHMRRTELVAGVDVQYQDMPTFVASQLVSTYGIKELAEGYLAQLILGLRKESGRSLRLQIFMESLGMGDETKGAMPPQRQQLMLSVLLTTVTLLDKERTLTRCRRDQFFARFGEYNELFIPFEYLRRAFQETAADALSADFRGNYVNRVSQLCRAHLLESERDCQNFARGLPYKRKGCVLAVRAGGPFMSVDEFLSLVISEHKAISDARSKLIQTIFRKFDLSDDGHLDREEFGRMVKVISPHSDEKLTERLWVSCHGGDGKVDPSELERALYECETHDGEMAQAMHESHGAMLKQSSVMDRQAQDSQRFTGQISAMTKLWDGFLEDAKDKAVESYLDHWTIITKMQAWYRGSSTRKHLHDDFSSKSPDEPGGVKDQVAMHDSE